MAELRDSIAENAGDSGRELAVARGRLGLGLIAPISIYIDPSNNGWLDITGYSLAVLVIYLAYAAIAYRVVRSHAESAPTRRYLSITALLDVAFAAAVALVTEGPTSPSWLFFVFAILAVNLRTEFRVGSLITLFCSAIYLVLLIIAAPGREFEMRAAYLAMIGYLIRFFGRENARLEGLVRDLQSQRQRHEIARALHDGYIQALAGVNLQLDTCRKLLKSGRSADAVALVDDIQGGVKREFDEVRAFVRSLADRNGSASHADGKADTCFEISASFKADGMVSEQILQIMIEAVRNTRRHASAHLSTLRVTELEKSIDIAVDDDGVGLAPIGNKPWTIESRVSEYDGTLQIASDHSQGTHIRIQMPKR